MKIMIERTRVDMSHFHRSLVRGKQRMACSMRFFLVLISLLMLLPMTSCNGSPASNKDGRITITLAAPANPYIQDFNSNLYKLWLEEQSGLNLEIIWLPGENAETIARRQLSSGEDLPDAYIGFGSLALFGNAEVQAYGEKGAIIPLNDLIERYGENTKALWAELPEYDIERYMTSADGNIYFMPGFSSSTITRYRQLMWVNKGWLEQLELSPPTTTEEFRDMLRAFKTSFPDRIPMTGTEDHYSKQPYDFLFNAFIYNDVNNTRLLIEDGVVGFAPVRDEWRNALIFMRSLYEEELYSPLSFIQDNQQMNQIANDPDNILGAFMSPGITLTVLQNSPENMERYIGIEPLEGSDGVKLTTVYAPSPKPNGVITSACEYPEEVFKLFDLMLSEEASLMGRYGEQGVDWEFADSDGGEISIYGTPATIKLINQIWNVPQNKHLCQIVPYVSRPKFSGGVTWNGNIADGEYINAQAAMLHRDYEPEEYIGSLIFTPEEHSKIEKIRTDIETHIGETIVAFITGTRDIYDDGEWEKYVSEFDGLGLPEFISAAQTAIDRWSILSY